MKASFIYPQFYEAAIGRKEHATTHGIPDLCHCLDYSISIYDTYMFSRVIDVRKLFLPESILMNYNIRQEKFISILWHMKHCMVVINVNNPFVLNISQVIDAETLRFESKIVNILKWKLKERIK